MTCRLLRVPPLLLALGLLAGCPGPPSSSDRARASSGAAPSAAAATQHDGKLLYEQSCAACHGMDAKGLPNLGKDMTASEFMKAQSDDQLLQFIKQGRAADDPANTTKIPMPPKGGNPALDDAKLKAIITHLRSLQA